MAGLDKIISRLEDDCITECDRIISDANIRAAETVARAQKDAQQMSAEIMNAAQKEVELILKKAKSSAALNDRRMILESKIALIDETVEAAVKKLRSLDDKSYFGVLTHLVGKYRRDGEGVLFLSKKDLERMPVRFCTEFAGIRICDSAADISDGFILKYGDIEINCTFSSMLNASRDELKSVAGELLFG